MKQGPPPETFVLHKRGLSFYLKRSPVRERKDSTVEESGGVTLNADLNNIPYVFIFITKGKLVLYNGIPDITLDYKSPISKLSHEKQCEYGRLYFDIIRTTAISLLKLYFKQGPQKATLCFIWCAKGRIHRDIIQKIARLVWNSRSDMHLWAAANRHHMPY